MSCFYTYIHETPDGRVFYVGKGQKKRAWSWQNRNSAWREIATKGFIAHIMAEGLDEESALQHERELIQSLRAFDVELVNRTTGGQGVSGMRHSDEAKARMSAKKLGSTLTEETRKKLSLIRKGRKKPKGSGKAPKAISCVETGAVYESISCAVRALGLPSSGTIRAVLSGKLKTAHGFHWSYA